MNPFTPAQIQIIEQMIDRRIQVAGLQRQVRAVRSYHTIPEIRVLIAQSIEALRNELGDGEFDIAVFRHALARQTVLREGDTEISNNKIRWDAQVSNAIEATHWPDCPIEPGSRRRHYRFKPTVSSGD